MGDRKVRDFFDRLFDMDRDGKLDAGEQGFQYEYLDRLSEGSSHPDDDEDDDEFDEDEVVDEDDSDDWKSMDTEDKRDAMIEAGLDPDDYESAGYDIDNDISDGDF